MMTEFKRKFGKHISDDRLPSQSTFKHFSEKLAEGTLKAEPLSRVISLFEEEQQELKKPEPARQYNLPLVSRLTITAKRRHITSEPTDEKGLRLKHAVLTSLAQMRQPGRSIYKDLEKTALRDFLDTLLEEDNFNFYKEVDGRPLISPCWSFCLSYEFERRREAIRLCKEQSFGIQAALQGPGASCEALASTCGYSKFWNIFEQAGVAGNEEKDCRCGKSSIALTTKKHSIQASCDCGSLSLGASGLFVSPRSRIERRGRKQQKRTVKGRENPHLLLRRHPAVRSKNSRTL